MKNSQISCFDYQNFYSEENARIIEVLLDKGVVSIKEIVAIFGIEEDAVIDFFQALIKPWLEEEEKIGSVGRIECVFANINDRYAPILGNTLLHSDRSLAFLVAERILPLELCLLPRFSNKQIGFDITPDYYEEYCKDIKSSPDKLIKLPNNYCDEVSRAFTYQELKSYLKKQNIPISAIKKACLEGRLGAYLEILEKHIKIFSEFERPPQSLDFFRKGNCGNPFYLKRYKGLERLPQENKDWDFSIENLFLTGSYTKNLNYLIIIPQMTDFENKVHIGIIIESFNGKNKIEINELVFPEEEVIRLIDYEVLHGLGCPFPILGKIKERVEENVRVMQSEEQQGVMTDKDRGANSLSKDGVNNVSDRRSTAVQVQAELQIVFNSYREGCNEIRNSRQRNKAIKEAVLIILKVINEVAKSLGEEFDPLFMPGQRSEFYKFCEKLFPSLFKKGYRNALYEICVSKMKPSKRGKKKPDPLCGWGERQKEAAPTFWSNIESVLCP